MALYDEELYTKVKKVIQSCETFGHLIGANQYAILYLNTLPIYLLETRRTQVFNYLNYQKRVIKFHKLEKQ